MSTFPYGDYPYADDNRGRTRFTSGDVASIAENSPTTTPVYTAKAHVLRNPHRHISYSLQPGVGDNDLFAINATTGVVTFKASPDYESPHGPDYTIVVTASDGIRSHTARHAVHVHVTDVNDNAPVFTSGTTATTPENVSTTTAVYTAHATDADGTAANNTVHYSLAANVGDNNLFNINATTGAVTFKTSPDYEHPMDAGGNNVYDIVVTASDGLAAHDVTRGISISVTDVNDNAPVFTSGTTASEAENTAASNVVYTAHASDADGTSPNNQVHYSLAANVGDNNQFNIDATTGAVTFKTSPDYEHPTDAGGNNVYDIVVTATDGGTPSLSTNQSVAISVTDVNDNAPVFTSGATASEAENTPASTIVYTAHATDADGTSPNNSVTYSLSGTDTGAFNIDAATGAVTFKTSPDYEHPTDAGGNNVYDIVVTATDGGTPSLSTSQAVSISVTDVNDNAPVFTSGTIASEAENTAASNVVYTAHATDADGTSPNNTVTYSLSGTDAGAFNIDATTGAVTFKASPDYEHPTDAGGNNVYDIVVTATDGGTPSLSTSQAVTISVTDVNDNAPVFTSGTTASEAENTPASTAVYTAHATDADGTSPNNTVTYSLSGTDAGAFNIDATTGAVTFKTSPDYEHPTDAGGNNVYDVVVTATDGGTPSLSTSQAVAISVTDVNDNAPVFTSGTTASEAENTAASNVVYTAHATDADGTSPNNSVTYSLSGTDAGAFNIDAATGAVTFKTSPDYEHPTDAGGNNVYDIVVTATDGGTPSLSTSQAVSISVTDVNDNAPVFTSGTTASEAENTAASNVVYTAHATDADGTSPNNSVTYSLSGTDSAAFNIDAATGAVTFKTSPDYEHPTDAGGNNVYDIVVTATDGGTPSLSTSQAVAISVTDVNDNAPVFTSGATATEAENTAASNIVYTAHATDADGTSPNNSVTYSLSGTDSAAFNIDATTGAVTFKTSPDYEHPTDAGGNNVYDVVVTATDGGTPSLSTSQAVSISVTDVNDNAPVFTSGTTASEAENTPASTAVYTAHATDADGTSPNNSVTYSLSGTDAGAFNIDATTGAVTFKASPDYEHPTDAGGNNVYDIVVTATDGGTPSLSTSQAVSISVTDVNDNAPVFTSGATASEAENTAASNVVYTAHATDADGTSPNNSVTYSLSGTDSAAFNIDATTGAVTFKASPDYEHPTDAGGNNVYDIVVTATDGGTPSLSTSQAVAISVTDVNDNAPVFTSGTMATEAENTAASNIVYTAHATDADGTSPNNTVTYSLSGTDSAAFNIDATTGAVTFKASPDYEHPTDAGGNNVYDVVVTATDGGTPSLSTSQAVAISVTDVNDNAPVFTSGTTASEAENTAASNVVYTAHATDADGTSPNNTVTYSLSGTDAGAFNIDAATGAVTFKASPDYEHPTDAGGNNVYDIVVTATDGGTPSLSTSQAVAISVTDVAPVFNTPADGDPATNQTYGGAAQGSPTGVQASASDPGGGTVTYSLIDNDGGHFQIDPATGVVTVGTTPLAYDSANPANDTRTITVEASDPSGLTSTHSYQIVVAANSPPVANDDATTATEAGGTNNGTPGSNPSGNVILGTGGHGEVADTDAQDPASALTVVAVHTGVEGSAGQTAGAVGTPLAGQYGTLTLQADGSYTYAVDNSNATVNALNPAQTLTDAFNYTIQDTGGLQDTATIRVTIHGADDAPTAHMDAVSATEAGGVANATPGVDPSFNVVSGAGETIASGRDTDPDSGDTLAVVGVAAGTTGAALSAGVGTDVAGTFGTIHIDADGSATYVVNQAAANSLADGQIATDAFSYTVADTGGLTSTTQVIVTVHGADDSPTAVADTSASPGATAAAEAGGTNNGTPGHNGSGNVLANDTDPDQGDSLVVQGVEAGNHTSDVVASGVGTPVTGTFGSINVQANGSYTYVVNQAAADSLSVGASATDTFTYTIQDSHGLTSTSTVTVTINGADDAPVAVADGSAAAPLAVTSGVPSSTNLLANDTDVDVPHTLTAVKDSDGAHGTVVVNPNGTFIYTANAGFYGTDSFTYHANDGALNSNSATVTVSVQPNVAYINNASTSSTEDGSFANPYKSIASFNAANDATHNYGVVYVEKGTGTYSSATGLTLRAGQTLEGQGVDASYVDSSGQTVVLHDFDNTSGSVPTITITGGTNAVTLASNNTIAGLNISGTGGVNGIADNGSSVGTFNLQGVGITTANGTGLSLAHGGTFTAAATTATPTDASSYGNVIATSGTGTALAVVNTNFGSADATFQSISATGSSGNAGLVLQNTGTAGGLHVTGAGNPGSGGTIADKTGGDIVSTNATTHVATVTGTGGTGIFLSGTSDVQLSNMVLHDFSNFGIYGNNVTGFQLSGSTINGVNGTNATLNAEEGSIRFDNLLTSGAYGTAAITNSSISGGEATNVFVSNTSGTLNRLTMTGDTIGANAVANQNNSTYNPPYNNVSLAAYNSGTVANLTFGGDGAGQGNTITGSAGGLLYTFAGAGGSTDVVVRHDTFQNAQTQNLGGGYGSVTLASEGAASGLTFDVSHNTWTGPGSTTAATQAFQIASGVATGASGSTSGTINANTVNGGADGVAMGITAYQVGNGTSTVLVSNNAISNYAVGIYGQNVGGSGTMNLSIFGNTVSAPAAAQFPLYAIGVDDGRDSTDSNTMNLAIGSHTDSTKQNVINDPSGLLAQYGVGDFGIDTVAGGSTLNLSQSGSTVATRGKASSGANLSAISQLLNDDNHGNGNRTLVTDDSGSNGDAAIVSSMPSLPPAVAPMLAAAGGVVAAKATPGVTALTQSTLDGIVHAAIADWIAAGATVAQVAALEAATYKVADLPAGVLGREGPGVVEISSDAAGYGWFVDAGAPSNAAFAHAANAAGTDFYADPTSAAAGHMDLLTTVMHEMGHVLDLADTSLPADGHDLMYVAQVTGERRLPGAIDVADSLGTGLPVKHVAIADDAGPVALHLRPLAAGETARIESLPQDATLTLHDGTTVHAGMSLSASQFKGLEIHPTSGASHDYFLFDIVDAQGRQTAMNAVDLSIGHDAQGAGLTMVGTNGADRIAGSSGSDVIYGGSGHDVLTGGGGADHFVFDQASIAAGANGKPHAARITDYSAAQGDTIDLSGLFGGHAAGQQASALARVAVTDGHATLDANLGTASAPHWVEIAHLHGVHAGAAIDVVTDSGLPAAHLHAGLVS